MSTVAVFRRPPRAPDVTSEMYDLISDIEQLVSKSCELRQALHRSPDKQMSACALDDMIDLLDEVRLRLRVDASGHLRG